MAESLRFSVGAIGGSLPSRLSKSIPAPTLNEAFASIGRLPISEDDKKHLCSLARKSPSGSLGHLLSNYVNYLKKP